MNEQQVEKIKRLEGSIVANHKGDKAFLERLTRAQHEYGILDDGRPFAPVLLPYFFSRTNYTKLVDAAETLSSALESMTFAALENDEIMDELDLSENELTMARIEPGYRGVCHSSRFDAFLHGDGFKFLEFNGESPAGIIDQMQIEKVLELIPEVSDFLRVNPHWKPKPHVKLLEALVEGYRDFGGKEKSPNIAIVDWLDVATVTEFEVLKEYFESMGHRTNIIDPHGLEYDGKVLRAGDFEIDIFYKRVIIHEYLEKFGTGGALSKAYHDGNVFMANSFRAKIPNKKAGFAVLANPKFSYIFSAGQQAAIDLHIPWTRRVRNTKTDFKGVEIDLTEFIRRRHNDLILKPNDDYGGSGISFSWECTQADWDEAIGTALDGSYVVQERAPLEKVPFLTYADEIKREDVLIDFDPFLFRGRVEGGLVRMSSKTLINVAQGGYETALVVLDDPV